MPTQHWVDFVHVYIIIFIYVMFATVLPILQIYLLTMQLPFVYYECCCEMSNLGLGPISTFI